jgi:hypothetical protein
MNRGSAAADNIREEDARHFYIWSSLHCIRSMTRRFATFIASESNDFFLRDVIRNWLARRDRTRDWPQCRSLTIDRTVP